MAERVTGKSKKPARKAPAKASGGQRADTAIRDRVAELEKECLRLKDELADAQTRLAAFAAQHEELVNRIDWAIDSLNSLAED
jgi:hypothetical protein